MPLVTYIFCCQKFQGSSNICKVMRSLISFFFWLKKKKTNITFTVINQTTMMGGWLKHVSLMSLVPTNCQNLHVSQFPQHEVTQRSIATLPGWDASPSQVTTSIFTDTHLYPGSRETLCFCLARAGKMGLSCPLGIACIGPTKAKFC